MADNDGQPSWKRFENHEGTSEDDRTEALRRQRVLEGHGRPLGGARGGVGLNRIVHKNMIHRIK